MGMLTMASATQLRQQMDEKPLLSSTSKANNGQDGPSKFEQMRNNYDPIKKLQNKHERNKKKNELAKRVKQSISLLSLQPRNPKEKQCNVGASSLSGKQLAIRFSQVAKVIDSITKFMNGKLITHPNWFSPKSHYEYKLELEQQLKKVRTPKQMNLTDCKQHCEKDDTCVGWMFSEKWYDQGGCRIFTEEVSRALTHLIYIREYTPTKPHHGTHLYAMCTHTQIFTLSNPGKPYFDIVHNIKHRQVEEKDCEERCQKDNECIAWLNNAHFDDHICYIIPKSPDYWYNLKQVMTFTNTKSITFYGRFV